jgi:hypothetical protein
MPQHPHLVALPGRLLRRRHGAERLVRLGFALPLLSQGGAQPRELLRPPGQVEAVLDLLEGVVVGVSISADRADLPGDIVERICLAPARTPAGIAAQISRDGPRPRR